MKLIAISDVHATSNSPRGRIGDQLEDFSEKMSFVFSYAKKINAPIICAGDLFDRPRDILALFKFLSITSKYPEVKFFSVYGQHDMYFRNKSVPTNIGLLSRSGVVNELDKPYVFKNDNKKIKLYGCNWNETAICPSSKNINILSIHASIYHEELYPGQKLTGPNKFMKENSGYDFIICGDIHRSFISRSKYGIIANTGPMMRLEATDYCMKHKPHFIIFDIENKTVKKKFIPCKNGIKVLNPGVKTKKKETQHFSLKEIFNDKKEINRVDISHIIDRLLNNSKNKDGIKEVLSKVAAEVGNE